jgi:hypothetical protein
MPFTMNAGAASVAQARQLAVVLECGAEAKRTTSSPLTFDMKVRALRRIGTSTETAIRRSQ